MGEYIIKMKTNHGKPFRVIYIVKYDIIRLQGCLPLFPYIIGIGTMSCLNIFNHKLTRLSAFLTNLKIMNKKNIVLVVLLDYEFTRLSPFIITNIQ
jgi:hypothetical protein